MSDVTNPASSATAMRWLPAAAFVVAAGMAALLFGHAGFFNDDALITVRYSENLAHGNGLVYNAGERVLGTTTPLWALILAGVSSLGLDPVSWATRIGLAAFGWTAAATVILFRRRGAPWWTQTLAGLLVASSPILLTWAGSGMETSFYVAALATFILLFEAERWVIAGFVGGAMLLLRPDAGLVLAAAAAFELARSRSVRALLRVLPGFLLVVVPWLIAAGLYYGSPLPNSGFAKRLQIEDWGTYRDLLGRSLWAVGPVLPTALVGLASTFTTRIRALPALAFVAVAAGMHLGGLPGCGWYIAPAMYLVLVLSVDGAWLVAAKLAPGSSPLRSATEFAVLVGPLLGHLTLPGLAHDLRVGQLSTEWCHARVGDWLREHAPKTASVAVDNIGYIGYRSGLRVIDMLGLVQTDTVRHLAAGERDWAIRSHEPEFIATWLRRGNSWKYLPPAKWLEDHGYRIVFEAPVFPEYPQGQAYGVYSRLPTEPK